MFVSTYLYKYGTVAGGIHEYTKGWGKSITGPLYIEISFYFRVGQAGAKSHQDIQLSGENILDEHCILEHTPGMLLTLFIGLNLRGPWSTSYNVNKRSCLRWFLFSVGVVKIIPCENSRTFVNGKLVTESAVLRSGVC